MDKAYETLVAVMGMNWCKVNLPRIEELFKMGMIDNSDQYYEKVYEKLLKVYEQDISKDETKKLTLCLNEFDNVIKIGIPAIHSLPTQAAEIGASKEMDESNENQLNGNQLTVCTSDIFNKSNMSQTTWHPNFIVNLGISYTKSYEISPDVKDELNQSALNMIFKWKGLLSPCSPLVIPIYPKEFQEYIIGSILMFSLFNPPSEFPIKLTDPESCKQMLSGVSEWSRIGQIILDSFEINAEHVGMMFRQHLTNVISSSGNGEVANAQSKKRARTDEKCVESWSKRKSNYLKAVQAKQKTG